MSKPLLIIGGISLSAAIIYGVTSLSSKAAAASDLKIAFGSLNIKKVSFKDGILMDVILKATNGSSQDLEFSQPFVQISILNDKGVLTPIALSNDANGMVKLPARKTSDLKFNLQVTPLQATKIPGLIMHMVSNAINPSRAKKTIVVEYGFTALNKNFKQKQNVQV